ncbi:MAG: PH domain-containing protein [Mucilaginibacter sp.]
MDFVIQDRVFKSKVGFVFYFALIAIAIFGLIVFFGVSPAKDKDIYPILIAFGLPVLFIASFLNTKYTITSDNLLKIKSGFIINKQVPISTISKIKPTGSWLSAPALSFDRLEIFYDQFDSVVISPKDKDEFIALLKTINPGIVTL